MNGQPFKRVKRAIDHPEKGARMRLTFDGKNWTFFGVPVTVGAHERCDECGDITDPLSGYGCRCCYSYSN